MGALHTEKFAGAKDEALEVDFWLLLHVRSREENKDSAFASVLHPTLELKVVLDTSILVVALRSKRERPFAEWHGCEAGTLNWSYLVLLFLEYENVLKRLGLAFLTHGAIERLVVFLVVAARCAVIVILLMVKISLAWRNSDCNCLRFSSFVLKCGIVFEL